MRRISFLALLVGGVVSFLLSIALAVSVGVVVCIKLAASHQISSTVPAREMVLSNPVVYAVIVALQIVSCIPGGFLAGVTARHHEALNGLVSSVVVILLRAGLQGADPHPQSIRILKMAGYVA